MSNTSIQKENIKLQSYLLDVGIRSEEYTYDRETLHKNIAYFKQCYKKNLSAYKALLFFNDYLNKTL